MKSAWFRFEFASQTDSGRIRALNEDGVAIDPERGFAVVTDGMGGHRAGDVASRIALESIARQMEARPAASAPLTHDELRNSVATANTAVRDAAKQQGRTADMGTTLAMAVFADGEAIMAHVGDSRIYRLRQGKLELLTRDDSMLNDQVEMGLIAAEEAGDSRNRHFVTQALGMSDQVTIHTRTEVLCDEDVYLLCTDGLSDLVADRDITLILDELKTNLPLTASHLVQLANDCGGLDNISVALVRIIDKAANPEQRPWLARFFGLFAH